MTMFNSYVGLPEGNIHILLGYDDQTITFFLPAQLQECGLQRTECH